MVQTDKRHRISLKKEHPYVSCSSELQTYRERERERENGEVAITASERNEK